MNRFYQAWKKAQKNIFRLERLPIYRVKGDWENFQRWKKGRYNLEGDKKFQSWIKLLKATKRKGVAMKRVRVLPSPLNDYIKYEIDCWKKMPVSEDIQFISKEKYQSIIKGLSFKPTDFWMFDDKALFLCYYNKSGDLVKREKVLDRGMIKKYLKLKNTLLRKVASKNTERRFK